MVWDWTRHGGLHFAYDLVALEPLERRFLMLTGGVGGLAERLPWNWQAGSAGKLETA